MVIDYIELENFKFYKDVHHFKLDKLNLIKGSNGVGKTTLVKDSISFCLYGQAKVVLAELVNKENGSGCSVTIKLVEGVDSYVITRKIPTKLIITKNNDVVEFHSNTQAQQYINELIGDFEYFKKLRLIDTKEGENLLEATEAVLKKNLSSVDNKKIDNIKNSLLAISNERKKLNRDEYAINKHYPSEKRLQYLKVAFVECNENISLILKEIKEVEYSYYLKTSKVSRLEGIQYNIKNNKNKVLSENTCTQCGQPITDEMKQLSLHNLRLQLPDEGLITNLKEDSSSLKEIITLLNITIDKNRERKERITKLINKLESRIKQSNLIYCSKDVLVSNNAVKVFNNFTSFYFEEQLKNLLPIINDIISIIGFKLLFKTVDGKLKKVLIKGDKEYVYDSLSEAQRMILGIAFKLSILLKEGKSGFIVADEGFGCLDEENLNNIFELFNHLPFQLISVVHRYSTGEGVNLIGLGE